MSRSRAAAVLLSWLAGCALQSPRPAQAVQTFLPTGGYALSSSAEQHLPMDVSFTVTDLAAGYFILATVVAANYGPNDCTLRLRLHDPGGQVADQSVGPVTIKGNAINLVVQVPLLTTGNTLALGAHSLEVYATKACGADFNLSDQSYLAVFNSQVPGGALVSFGAPGQPQTGADQVLAVSGAGTDLQVASAGNVTTLSLHMSSSGSQSVAVGPAAVGSATGTIAVGNNPVATAAHAIAIGNTANATASDAIAIGDSAQVGSAGGIGIGKTLHTVGVGSVAIGDQTTLNGDHSVCIGELAACNSLAACVGKSAQCGDSASCVGEGCIALTNGACIGAFCTANTDGTALGGQSSATAHCVALGEGASCADNNTVIVGSTGFPLFDFYLGNGKTNASPSLAVLHATGASGSNVAGGAIVLSGGRGTGTGVGGDVKVYRAAHGSSGSSQNTNTTAWVFDGDTGTLYPYEGVHDVGKVTKPIGELYETSQNQVNNQGPYVDQVDPGTTGLITSAGQQIDVAFGFIALAANGNYTLSGTPTLLAPATGAGTRVTFVNTTTNTVAFQDDGTLAGSTLHLTGTSITLGQWDTISLLYEGTAGGWIETSFANNQ